MNNSFSLTCSQCGGQIQFPKGRTRIKCPYCGTEQDLTGEVAQQVQMEGVHICPVCNKDDKLEKLSALVMKETGKPPSQLIKWLTLSEPDYHHVKMPDPPFPPRKKDAASEA